MRGLHVKNSKNRVTPAGAGAAAAWPASSTAIRSRDVVALVAFLKTITGIRTNATTSLLFLPQLDRVAVGVVNPQGGGEIQELDPLVAKRLLRRFEVFDLDGHVRIGRVDRLGELGALDQVQLPLAQAVPGAGKA